MADAPLGAPLLTIFDRVRAGKAASPFNFVEVKPEIWIFTACAAPHSKDPANYEDKHAMLRRAQRTSSGA